jgi:pimeloyl-ACP methyl ester carboxylesterase
MKWIEKALLGILNPYKKTYIFETIECKGNMIKYHQIGNKEGEILVCLPGLLGIAPYFYILLRPMLLKKYNVFIIDNYYGDVRMNGIKNDKDYIDRLYDVFKEFMIQQDLKNVYLIANSLGTIFIKKYAIEFPTNVKKIICLGDSGLSEHYELDGMTLNKGTVKNESKKSVKTDLFLQLKMIRMIVNKWWKIPFGTILWYRSKLTKNPIYLRRMFIIAAATKKYDFKSSLKDLKCDVVLVHGIYDRIVSIKVRDIYKKYVNRLHFYELPVGHEVLNEDPSRVTNIIYKELNLFKANTKIAL